MNQNTRRHWRTRGRSAIVAAAALLGGCATFSPDGGFSGVESAVKERTGKGLRWAKSNADAGALAAEVKRLLERPLGVEEAVQVALLNNRGLQAAYAELGIAESDLVQAGRLINPGFSYGRLTRGDEVEIERRLVFSVLDLLTIGRRTEIATQRFEQIKLNVASEALRVASEARRTWVEAVAARESLTYFEQVREAAEASAELSERMARLGNFSKLQRMREQAFYAEASAQLARARHNALAARERLTRALGLWGEDLAFRLPERLPQLPAAPRELVSVEIAAIRDRLDVRAAKHEAESLAASLGLTGATRYVNVLELGLERNSETGKPVQKGWELELRLPIFDSGDARLARAQHLYTQALHRAAQVAVNARSEAREAYGAYRSAYDLAGHYRDEIVPLRKRISEENLLRYNGMLIGVFELLADARESTAAVNAAIEALRDFWLAEGNLQMALTGRSPGAISAGAAAAAMPVAGQGVGH
jgi:outer membrane protein TolC